MPLRAWLSCALAAVSTLAAPREIKPRETARFEVLREPVTLPGGAIMAIGIRLRDGVQEVSSRDSADDGASWSAPRSLFMLPRREGGFGFFTVLLDRHGELHLFLLCDGNTGGALPRSPGFDAPRNEILDIWQARSTNGRTVWLRLGASGRAVREICSPRFS